jgi:predicted ATPase
MPTVMTQFVGRMAELAALREVARQAVAQGRPVAAVVSGDPGSGKSRLLREASLQIPIERRIEVVGYEPERAVPLAAANGLLRSLAKADEQGLRLRALLLADTAPEQAALEPMRIFEAAHQSLNTLWPVLITVDDLRWVDDLSLALLHYLIPVS